MFTPDERDRLREHLLQYGAADKRISGAAITGSAAGPGHDRWSDIDLAFGVSDPAEVPHALSDWTAHMVEHWQALHHFDVKSGAWIYRVFLLASTCRWTSRSYRRQSFAHWLRLSNLCLEKRMSPCFLRPNRLETSLVSPGCTRSTHAVASPDASFGRRNT